MYGWRGRIGLMVPTGNTVMEPEFWRLAPEGVSIHANRVYLKEVSPEALLAMETDAARSAEQLTQCRLDVLCFGCTSGSFVGGRGYDERLIKRMEEVSGLPSTTTSTAVLRALKGLGVSRIALATPYSDEVTEIEKDWLQDNGIEVTAWQGGGIVQTADIQECDPKVSYRRARAVDSDRAEAVFISCTGFRAIENLEKLEADLGKPVISSNQASFADCLRLMGVSAVQPGFGSLFGRLFQSARGLPTDGKQPGWAAQ